MSAFGCNYSLSDNSLQKFNLKFNSHKFKYYRALDKFKRSSAKIVCADLVRWKAQSRQSDTFV